MKPYTYFCPNHDFFDASVGISRSYGRIGTYYLDPGQLLFNYKWPCLHGKGDFNAIFQHTDLSTLQLFPLTNNCKDEFSGKGTKITCQIHIQKFGILKTLL